MTGLLIKDWKLMTHQRSYFTTVTLLALLILFVGKEGYFSFSTSYVVWLFAYFTLSTLNYDEYDNGMPFLMTLPIGPREYVAEKYLFGYLLTAVSWILMMIIGGAWLFMTGGAESWMDYFLSEAFILMFIIFFLTVSIPMQLKFGAEKGRMIMIMVIVLFGVVILQAGQVLLPEARNLISFLPDWFRTSVLWLSGLGILFCLLITAISYGCSLNIMKKRQF